MAAILEVQKIPLWDPFTMRPLAEEGLALSGEDLATYKQIASAVQDFSKQLGLSERTICLSTNPNWVSFYEYFFVPSKCFSEKTRDRIYQVWAEKGLIPEPVRQEVAKVAAVEREIFTSMPEHEWRMLIGHELGHAWLLDHFKAFSSGSIEIQGKKVLDLKHDRALEKVCDFIGAYLTSPQDGIEAFKKESKNRQADDSEPNGHPPFPERIAYLSEWINDPKFKSKLTEDLVLEVGGPDFREAAAIYEKYGK